MGERLRRLADEKILSYPYKDVPTCWRRLYTDSSILEAAGRLSLASIVDEEKGADEALKGIERLDMALVVAGAPGQGREDIVHRLIVELQLYCAHQAEVTRPRKKARLEEVAEPAVERPIPRFSSPPDVDTYLRDLLASPFIITSGAADWPALMERTWSSPSYLLDVAGPGRVVPVEVGGTYTQATWSQRIMSFSTFLRCIGLAPATEQDKEDDLLYLAQHDLFRQLPQLQNDILIPDYLYSVPPAPKEAPNYAPPDTETGYILNAWLGPAGTTSPAHTDPYYNCFGALSVSMCRM